MIGVTIIALASLKEKYLKDAAAEYQKRLSAFCRLEVIEITPEKLADNPSISQINAALEREAEKILKKIPQNSRTVALCIEGGQLSSENFASFTEDAVNEGKNITFIIGSSYGLSERVKKRCEKRLSFSQMTFPHQLFRIMLLEQIYRAFKIKSGGTYHK
jgi:23S rRNA (pseudouridine1915-N3)-methyltransferase